MKGKFLNISIFVLSIICLIISVNLFWNMGIYVDEFNTSPSIILGGDFWNYMNWLKLAFTAVISILSGISLFSNNK
ncbi:hypothetical protein [Clostridium gasigenes]|uniref:hypothetical protein n=1 Tax=Clostridium gasigenes TaxID=94869 RepID=UPI001C0BDEAF|nr:hypothetical protein [Clostridium gasigenes]MBU3106114.1 hypothetical protein [Clostridium gasigenes]